MSRKKAFLAILAIAAIATAVSLGIRWHRVHGRPFNILIITLDTTRADRLGCYGYSAARTPVLDQLAREGSLFERAYCTVPLTLPSHASLFTGLYPPEHGLQVNSVKTLPMDVPTLAQVLSSNSYSTAAFIASPILSSKFGIARGFQEYADEFQPQDMACPGDYAYLPGNKVTDLAVSWLKENAGKPFFCWVHMYEPHFPYNAHEDVFGKTFTNRPYDAEIAFVDIQIGLILKELENNGSRRRTLVVVTGDHGESMPDDHLEPEPHHGFQVYGSTMHVPLIFEMPSLVPAGQRIQTPVSLVDVFQTVLSLARIPLKGPRHGDGLASLLQGDKTATPSPCYGQADLTASFGWAPLRCLTTAAWKYIRTPKAELYDMAADPMERTNLINELPQIVKQMDAELQTLEASMSHGAASVTSLSPIEQRKLESLGGYVSGGMQIPASLSREALRDIKDVLSLIAESQEAMSLSKEGKTTDAIQLWRRLSQASPETIFFRDKLGCLLTEAGKPDDAVTEYRRLMSEFNERDSKMPAGSESWKKSSIYPVVINNLAYALCLLGRFNEALPLATEAVTIGPSKPSFVHTLATTCRGLGQSDRAVEFAKTASSLEPESAEYLLLLAELLEKSDPVEAMKLAKQALNLSSREKDRIRALQLLKSLNSR